MISLIKSEGGFQKMKVLGAILRDKRKELDLSIQDVANELGLKYGTVANMETGGKNPTLIQLDAYGLIFGCTGIDIVSLALNMIKDGGIYSEEEEIELKRFSTKNEVNSESVKKEFASAYKLELGELTTYFEKIQKEFDEKRANENIKISTDIDSVINIVLERWTTKDSLPVAPREVSNLREEIKSIITMRIKHLTIK